MRTFKVDASAIDNMIMASIASFNWVNAEEVGSLLQTVKSGGTKKRSFKANIDGNDVFVAQTFSPIYDNDGKLEKVLNINMVLAQ
jgi:hypothetical protein